MPDPVTGSQTEETEVQAVEIPEGDWRHALPEDLRADKSFEPYKLGEGEEMIPVPPGLVKSYVGQQKLIGSKIVLPKEGDKPEVFEAFYKALGRPDKPEEYELPKDEAWESLPYSEKLEGWFRNAAHKRGLPAKVVTEMFGEYQNEMKGIFDEAQAELTKQKNEAIAALDQKWGAKSKENTVLADRAFVTIFGPEAGAVGGKYDTLLGDDAFFIERMYEISKLLGEDKLIGVESSGKEGIKTREELRAMMADPRYKTDKVYKAQVDAEYQRAFPG